MKGWEGTDGSPTALIVTDQGKVLLWTNQGEWLELATEFDPEIEAENLAEGMGLVPMHPDRINHLLSESHSDDELTGWGDSQEQ